jgi:crescentin
MIKLGGFFGRKALPPDALDSSEAPAENPLELDEELFSAHAIQLGAENETLRNLLVDASAKIDELDNIKSVVSKLVDPVGKALRAIEAERVEKLSLQTVLNNTRTAYGKLRNEYADMERKAAAADAQCGELHQELETAYGQVKAAEAAKSEVAADIAARLAQIDELEARLSQEATENKALAGEKRRLGERLQAAEKRINALESDLNSTRQRLMIADDEKHAQQVLLDRASIDAAQLSRKLAEQEANLNATQGRLRQVQANLAELTAERNRLAGALDEANERHEQELTSQRMRMELLQTRMMAGEKLLGEARQHLLARAEEISAMDRRLNEMAVERDGLQARMEGLEADRRSRETALHEMDQARNGLRERAAALAHALAAKQEALAQAEETIATQHERVVAFEQALNEKQEFAERTIEELTAAVHREQMERSVVEGALETARKDFTRVMRELLAVKRQMEAEEPLPHPIAANAA